MPSWLLFPLVVSPESFSFVGGLDAQTGKIIYSRSKLFGVSIKDKVFIYPCGRGSTTTSAVLLEAIRCSNAPCAIISVEVEPMVALGVLVAQELYNKTMPILAVSEDMFHLLHTGDYVIVDSTAGKLYRRDRI